MTDSPSPKRYLVRFADGTEIGPLDKQAIKAMAKAGRIKPDDAISQDGSQKWIAVSRVPGLLDSAVENDGTIPLAVVEQPITDPRVRKESVARASPPSAGKPPSASHNRRQVILGFILLGITVPGLILAVSDGASSLSRRSAMDTTKLGSSSSRTPEQTVAAFVADWIRSPTLALQYLSPGIHSVMRDYVANNQPSNFDGRVAFKRDVVLTDTATGKQTRGKEYRITPVFKWPNGQFTPRSVDLTIELDSGKVTHVFEAE